jgi:hypothetical protein
MATTTATIDDERHDKLRAHAVGIAVDLSIYSRVEATFVLGYALQIVMANWDAIDGTEVPDYPSRRSKTGHAAKH